MAAQVKQNCETLEDIELARLVAARNVQAVRIVTARNNQLLFRTAWSILKHRADAEDAVQGAYLKAFAAIEGFEGRSSLSTWLTRIVINEALGRKRAANRRKTLLDATSVTVLDDYREKLMRGSKSGTSPDVELARVQVRALLEDAIASLPTSFRLVFVMREVEGLTVEETSQALGVNPATVKTRHLRARRRLQQALAPEFKSALAESFTFAGLDCEKMTETVVRAWCGDKAGPASSWP